MDRKAPIDAPWAIISAPMDQAIDHVGGRPGAAKAPQVLLEELEARGLVPEDATLLHPKVKNTSEGLERDLKALSSAVQAALEAGRFPVVLGGDHGTSYATLRGAARTLERVAVVYLDVHLDMRAYEPHHTSGSSFRRLIEEGWLAPRDVHPVGIQRPEPGTSAAETFEDLEAFAEEAGVAWTSFETAREQGLATSALQAVSKRAATCLSVDMDCLDERWAPGVSAPGPDRFELSELIATVSEMARSVDLVDVVELSPPLDEGGRALESAVAVVEALAAARRTPS